MSHIHILLERPTDVGLVLFIFTEAAAACEAAADRGQNSDSSVSSTTRSPPKSPKSGYNSDVEGEHRHNSIMTLTQCNLKLQHAMIFFTKKIHIKKFFNC